MKTNITIRIDSELAHSAKILAVKRGSSLSKLVAGELLNLVSRDTTYKKVSSRAKKDIREAPQLSYMPISRDSLHDR
jgi:hypothetical protein